MAEHETPERSGYSKISLQLRDDDGRVTETIEVQEHYCAPRLCESPAICGTCGVTGDKRIILIGSTEDGMDIFVCYPCLADDSFAQTSTDPSRCINYWHKVAITGRPCPECPARTSEASDGTQYEEVDGRVMKRLPFASGWISIDR